MCERDDVKEALLRGLGVRFHVDEDVRRKFESIHIGVSVLRGVKCAGSVGSDEMEREIRNTEAEIRSRYTLDTLKDVPLIRLQRDFFWRMGIDPTKVRPASEALIRRILAGKNLPRISPVVNAYNIASVRTLITFSAFDADRISYADEIVLNVRFARDGEEVTLIGNRKRRLKNELVLTDTSNILCVYVHGDVDSTKVREDTENILIVAYGVPGIDIRDLERGISVATEYVQRFAGGEILFKKVF